MTTDSPEVVARIASELPLVTMLARSMRRQMGPHAVVEELASYGHEALLLAARTWDASRGVSFRRYASFRIRGAMIEAMRSKGPLPKRVYRKLRALEDGERVLEAVAEEDAAAPAPSPEAADARLGETLTAVATALAAGYLTMRSADDMFRPVADETETPEELAAEMEMARLLREAIAERPEAERTLLVRHYFEDVTFDAAAKELNLSKSWASRLHARAIDAIGKTLKRRERTSP